MTGEHDRRVYDSRIILYRSIKLILVVILAGIFFKTCIIDSIAIRSNQMAPTLINGDHVLVFRLPYISFFGNTIRPALAKPIVIDYPFEKNRRACLRIAGTSGDTIAIDNGVLVNSRRPGFKLSGKEKKLEIIPESYLPRDFFSSYAIPKKGAHLLLDSLSFRDFFFATGIIRQEMVKSKVEMKADLFIDDTISNDFFINEFSLYKGTIDTIPAKFQFNWIFWDKLNQYLIATMKEHSIKLKFSLLVDSKKTTEYYVKKDYAFMIADNWTGGLDSRYIGPIQVSSIVGRTFFVLWSYDKEFDSRFKVNRFGKIIK